MSEEERWEEMFDALQKYKEKYGNCNVPTVWPENKKLGNWARFQRRQYKRKKLSVDYIKRLEDTGFAWIPPFKVRSAQKWEDMFDALKEYKEEYGDCNVPAEWPENKQLYTWMSTQRGKYRDGELSADRVKHLEGIGFEWKKIRLSHSEEWKEKNEMKWLEMFDVLKEYKRIYGDCLVPYNWTENKQLYSWMSTQRLKYKNEELSADRVKYLEDIGFEWNILELIWEKMFDALNKYKEEHGDCNVTHSWTENKQLYPWVMKNRSYYKKGTLRKDQIKRLEKIGFEW